MIKQFSSIFTEGGVYLEGQANPEPLVPHQVPPAPVDFVGRER